MAQIRKYFGLFILAGIALGFFLPGPVLPLKPYLIYPLALMMFFSCLKISAKDLRFVERDWWKYLVILCIVFLLPTLVVLFAKPFLSSISFVGLMVIAAAPTAIAVVFLSDVLGGEPHKALIGTTLAHLLAPIVTPFLVWTFAHQSVNIDAIGMVIIIGKLVLIPFVLAQIARYFKWDEPILKRAGWANEFFLFLLIWATMAPASGAIKENIREFWIALGIIAVLLAVQACAGFLFGRGKKEKITWTILAISKNFTVSSVIVLTLFGAPALVGPAAFVFLSNALLIPLEFIALHKKGRD